MALCQTNPYLNLNCADTRNICKYFLTCHHACCQSTPAQFTHIYSNAVLSSSKMPNYSVNMTKGLKQFKNLARFFLVLIFPFNYTPILYKHFFKRNCTYIKIYYLAFIKTGRNCPYLKMIFLLENLEDYENWIQLYEIIPCPFS